MRRKPKKIKRYTHINTTYKARPHPLKVILTLAGVALLVFIGISIYEPIFSFIMGDRPTTTRPPTSQGDEPTDLEGETEGDASDPGSELPKPQMQAASRTVFLPYATAADAQALEAFLDALDAELVDSVMVDIKDRQGNVLFRTSNADAIAWGAAGESNGLDLAALSATLRERDLALAVRMIAFRDEPAARGDFDNAIRYQNSDWHWLDNAAEAGGKPWLNPYSPTACAYLEALAVEAVEQGATLVILEEVQFPDGSAGGLATFGSWSQGVTRQQALESFVSGITEQVEAAGGRVGVYLPVTGLTQTVQNEARYGGDPLKILDNILILGLLPYQFPEAGYSAEGLDVSQPFQQPAKATADGLAYAKGKLEDSGVEIIALLQGGDDPVAPGIITSREALEAQVKAATDGGAVGYVLHNTAGQYAFS